MSVKRCLACHEIIKEDICPRCKSTEFVITDDGGSRVLARSLCKIQKPDVKKTVLAKAFNTTKSWKDEYRRSILHEIEICVASYSYEFEKEVIKQKAETIVKVCEADALSFDKVNWLDQNFARIDTNRTLELTVSIQKKGNEIKKKKLSIEAPKVKNFWKIGVRLEEGLRIRLLMGDDSNYTMTEFVDLI